MADFFKPKEVAGDPRKEDCSQYVNAVYRRNEEHLHYIGGLMDDLRVNDTLQFIINDGNRDVAGAKIHIATTGSDARKEKKGDRTSPIDGIVLVQRGHGVPAISNEVRVRCLEAIKALDIFGGIEIKDLDRDRVAYCQDYAPPSPWPTIIVDLFPLGFRNKELVNLSKDLLCQEIVGSGGKSIVEDVKKRFKEYRNIVVTGNNNFKGNVVQHFNRDSGELFYDPSSAVKQGSVKFGPLRTVQMFLAHRILLFMRKHAGDKGFIQQIPGNVEEKIAVLMDEGALNLNPVEAAELAHLYQFFLWLFYLSEYCYSRNGQEKVAIVPDVQLFRENLDNLLKLVNLQR